MDVNSVIYVIAVSCQLTGSIFLIENFFPQKRRILKTAEENEPVIYWKETDFDGNITTDLEPQQIAGAAQSTAQNFTALLLIVIGYLLGIFGEVGNKCCTLLFVIVISLILYLIGKNISKQYAIKFLKNVQNN